MALVQGAARDQALVAIREIARDLPGSLVDSQRGGNTADDRVVRRRGHPSALAGLFHAHAAVAGIVPDGMQTCAALVEQGLDRATRWNVPGLYGGWAGLGWITTHLHADDDFVASHADRVLTAALTTWPASVGYDLIRGLVGVGVYFLERIPRGSAIRGLTMVLDTLEATTSDSDRGTTWFTRAEFLPEWQRERAPNGYFNVGVAHGVPGVCWLLGKMCRAGVGRDRAEPLLMRSLRWVRSVQPDPSRAEMPSWIAQGARKDPGRRMAWCYGPLGASAVVLEAARAIGDEQTADWARTLALACARVLPGEARIHDAGLCHGAAGNAHMFHRLHLATGEEVFRRAALRWFNTTLEFRRPGEGIGGYRMWGEVAGNRQGWLEDGSFLSGTGGVGLALLSAVTDAEPTWDRLLLLS